MKLEQSFEVQAPLQRVWEALIDVERVAPCLPGASITGRNDDGSYEGEFKVKIGPTSAAYAGKLQMEQIDEAAHSATMQAAGTDRRGQGGAKATIISSVSEAEGGATVVHVDTDYRITGRLARFGRGGMIEEISNRLLTEFATSLQAMLAGDGGAGEAAAGASTEAAAVAEPAAAEAEPAPPEPEPEPEPATAEFAPVEPAPAEPEPEPATAEFAPVEPAPAEPEPEPAGEAAQTAGVVADEPAPIVPDDPAPILADQPAEPTATERADEAPPIVEPPGPVDKPARVVEPPAPVPPAPEPAPAPQAAPAAVGTTAPPSPPPPLPPRESEPLDGLALMRSVLLKRAQANPAPFAAFVIGVLLALRLVRRRR